MEKLPAGAERINPITNRLLRPPKMRDLAGEARRRDMAALLRALVIYSFCALVIFDMTALILKYAFPDVQ